MSGTIRVLVIVAFLRTLAPTAARGQFVEASPRVITFEATGYTLIPPEQPPAQFIGLAPAPFGVDKVPFKVRIRLNNLPSGVATNFVIVSPSSGVAATQLSGISRVRPVVALNPKVVPYMRPGIYNLDVLFDNPEHPEFGAGGVSVNLRLNFPGLSSDVKS